MTHHLMSQNSILNEWMRQLRDESIQKDRLRFRYNLRRIGKILAYEISKTMEYNSHSVQTPLGTKDMMLPSDSVIILPILRAGIPLYDGMMDYLDEAGSGFVGSYRRSSDAGGFDIAQSYLTCPDLDGKLVILADPMLATGSSFLSALEDLKNYGKAKKIHIASVIASEQGIENLSQKHPEVDIWVADIDSKLNDKSYIIPGLGDAGDLAFGPKNQG